MKSLFTLFLCVSYCIGLAQVSGGGMGGSSRVVTAGGAPNGPVVRTGTYMGAKAQDIIYERGVLSTAQQVYLIDGNKVIGTPFLYAKWYGGSVTTQDEKVVTNYLFRYNIYNQTLMFFDGKDSLEIDQPIKEFSLDAPNETGNLTRFRFIHSDQYKKEKKPSYLEVVIDSSKGQLLKKTEKYLGNNAGDLYTSYDALKTFSIRTSFYYYDKDKKILTKIKPETSFIASLLNLDKERAAELDKYDLTNEAELKKVFLLYFHSTSASTSKPPF